MEIKATYIVLEKFGSMKIFRKVYRTVDNRYFLETDNGKSASIKEITADTFFELRKNVGA